MAFRFRRRETLASGVRRIARECVDGAFYSLEQTGRSEEDGVHEARKRFKEIRAVLRLVKNVLGDTFDVENEWYRDAGRSLSRMRESQVLYGTWQDLLVRFAELRATETGLDERPLPEKRLEALRESAFLAALSVQRDLLATLPVARRRITEWPLAHVTFNELSVGLHQTYRQGRRAMSRARDSNDDAVWHEWRKRSQDLWHQTQLLTPIAPAMMEVRKKRLKRLCHILGEDHDLAVFRNYVENQSPLFDPPQFRARLLERIVMRQCRLRDRASRHGPRIWNEKPKAYTRHTVRYWHAWRTCPNDGLI